MIDWRGNQIKEGVKIVYAVKQSTSVQLQEAIVLSVKEGNPDAPWYSHERKPQIKIRGTGQTNESYHRGRAAGRLGTLTAVENITVIR